MIKLNKIDIGDIVILDEDNIKKYAIIRRKSRRGMYVEILDDILKKNDKKIYIKDIKGVIYTIPRNLNNFQRSCNTCMSCMHAKDMFKKLGFAYAEYSTCIVCNKGISEDYIWFYKNSKTIEISFDINMQELQAINQQVKELGWYE